MFDKRFKYILGMSISNKMLNININRHTVIKECLRKDSPAPLRQIILIRWLEKSYPKPISWETNLEKVTLWVERRETWDHQVKTSIKL